jgi:hypothetical protein
LLMMGTIFFMLCYWMWKENNYIYIMSIGEGRTILLMHFFLFIFVMWLISLHQYASKFQGYQNWRDMAILCWASRWHPFWCINHIRQDWHRKKIHYTLVAPIMYGD